MLKNNEHISVSYSKIPVMLEYPEDSLLDRELVYLTRIPYVGEEIKDRYGCLTVKQVIHYDLRLTDMLCKGEYVAKVRMSLSE